MEGMGERLVSMMPKGLVDVLCQYLGSGLGDNNGDLASGDFAPTESG